MGFLNKIRNAFGSSKNFKYLDDLIHSGIKEIVLDSDIILEEGEESIYLEGIKLDVDDLIIDGNDFIIDAKGKTRIFSCSGENISIKNVTLKNGFSKEFGGAINNTGSKVCISKSVLMDNSGNGGGALYNVGELSIFDSEFAGNVTNGTFGSGGAILNKNELSIVKSKFVSNKTPNSAGAICNLDKLTISDSTFTRNAANGTFGSGGAILNKDELSIVKSKFVSNISNSDGGAICSEFNSITRLLDVKFKDNMGRSVNNDMFNAGKLIIKGKLSTQQPKTIINRKGDIFAFKNIDEKIDNKGKIIELKFLEKGQKDFTYLNELIQSGMDEIKLEHDIILNALNDEDETFKNGIKLDRNDFSIDGNGHTIDAQSLTRIFQCTGRNVQIKNIILKNGFSSKEGGAVYNNGKLSVMQSTLEGNISKENAGAVYNEYGELSIRDSAFTENTGRAIKNVGGGLNIISSTFTANTDGVLQNSEGVLFVCDSAFTGNTGGAILNSGSLKIGNMQFDNNGSDPSDNEIKNEGDLILFGKFPSNQQKTIVNKKGKIITSNGLIENLDNSDFIFELKLLEKDQKDFTYLNGLIQSGMDEIKLENDIILDVLNNEDITFKDGIKIDGEGLIIDGNGHTIDAQHLTRIFQCCGKDILIKNITLKNGFASKHGGAIYNNGELDIFDSTLIYNMSIEGSGGAIYNKGKLTITRSIFSENIVYHESGGAIFNEESSLIIEKSTFNHNITEYGQGGAIYNNNGKITLSDSSVEYTEGIAIYNNYGEIIILKSNLNENIYLIENYQGELTILGSELNKNKELIFNYLGMFSISKSTINCNAGRIFNQGGSATIKESAIINNEFDGIYNNGDFKIFDCVISNNQSPDNIILNEDSMQIYNTPVSENKSIYGISNRGDAANLAIFNGEFMENNVEESVLYNIGKFCGIEKTIFENNVSNNSANIINKTELTLISPKINDNGTILNHGHIFIKKSAPELENTILGEGTVENIDDMFPQGQKFDFGYLDEKIHESNNKEIILNQDITLGNYERDYYEGGMELDIDNLIIDGNGKTIDGIDKTRIFIITAKNITLKNIIFKNGHSHKNYDNPLNNNGGAIKINHNASVKIENCKFINNVSEENGGSIDNSGKLHISESLLNENIARSHGGAIKDNAGELTISDSTLNQNKASDGAGIFADKCTLIITHSEFANNIGNGAIYINTSKVTMEKSSIEQNKGVAIVNNEGSSLTLGESNLHDNDAAKGAAIYNHKSDLMISQSILSNNIVNQKGGALYNLKGTLKINKSRLINNKAKGDFNATGGAIFNDNGEISIYESMINENSTTGSGGAIWNEKGNLNISKSTFANNLSQSSLGGAINNWEGNLIISESLFSENNAKCEYDGKGGAIFNFKGTLTIQNSTFTKNMAKGDCEGHGGAINNSRGKLDIIDSKFTENISKYGGAIVNSGDLTIAKSIFAENVAQYGEGGAIWLENSTKYEPKNCTFKDNKPDDIN